MSWLAYHDSVEKVADGEPELFGRIIAVMRDGAAKVAAKERRHLRAGHSKALGLATGTLVVTPDLPPELAQGLFAVPARYDALVRLAHLPAEPLDDRGVSAARGCAVKLFGVPGPRLAGHTADTQDFLFDTGRFFNAANATVFLAEISAVLQAAALPGSIKTAVSTTARAAGHLLQAAGLESAHLDVLGHRRLHPLSETYNTQTPLRFGNHVAKLRLRPLGREPDVPVTIDGPDGLRDAVAADIAGHGMSWQLLAQLCTDLATMPVEDASACWPEDDSPFREVARLHFPAQDACAGPGLAVEERVSFAPGHSLAAHRPLGQINRARMVVYEVLARERRVANGQPVGELAGCPAASAGAASR